MEPTRRVALLLGQDLGYCRDVMRGIQQYVEHQTNWICHNAAPLAENLKPLREWKPHGVIAHLFLPDVADAMVRLRAPVVNTTSTLGRRKIPLVETDHKLVGRMAADHFLERRFENFGYFGSQHAHFSRAREAGFRNRLKEAGYRVNACYAAYLPRPASDLSWKQVDSRIGKWISELPKPVAILASNDVPARDLADMCRQLKIRVPEEVAILGVDNDELECRLSRPPLSSVQLPSEQIGYESAKLLDRLMSGRPAPDGPIILPPVRIITRQSTDIFAIDDDDVARALAFIREHFTENIGVDHVARKVGVHRRKLERKVHQFLGRTIHDEMRRVRIQRARELLASSRLPMMIVAERSGFSNARRFAVVFREATGETPSAYRARSLKPGEDPHQNPTRQ